MNKYKAYYKLSNGEPRVCNVFCGNDVVMDRVEAYRSRLEKHHESPVKLIAVIRVEYTVIQCDNGENEADIDFNDITKPYTILDKFERRQIDE